MTAAIPPEMPMRLAGAPAVARESETWLAMAQAWGADPVPPPVIIPDRQRAEWQRLADHPVFSAEEQAAQDARWLAGLRERMYEGARKPDGWLTGEAQGADGTPPPPGPSKSGTIPPPVEEVMPDGPASTAALENVPLPGQDAERAPERSITAQGHSQPDDDEADRIQHAAEDSLRRAGVKDEDIADLHRPHDQTAEMTAVLPVPQESERQ